MLFHLYIYVCFALGGCFVQFLFIVLCDSFMSSIYVFYEVTDYVEFGTIMNSLLVFTDLDAFRNFDTHSFESFKTTPSRLKFYINALNSDSLSNREMRGLYI